MLLLNCLFYFFFNDTATTEIYTLSLTTLFRSEGRHGRVHIEEVVERQLLAVVLHQLADAARLVGCVQGGPLVRVLAVAQGLAPLEDQRQRRGQRFAAAGQVVGDRGVVGGGVGEDLGGEPSTQPRACARG